MSGAEEFRPGADPEYLPAPSAPANPRDASAAQDATLARDATVARDTEDASAAQDATAAPVPPQPRSAVRVVRPGGSGRGGVGAIPPMPMAPPSVLPPWLAAARSDAGQQSAGQQSDGPQHAGPFSAVDPLDGDLGPEERRLREHLHSAVGGLQPSADSLASLRRAVPQRRARRRRRGGVVTALVLGVLGGALLHGMVTSSTLAQGPQAGQGYQSAAPSSSSARGDSSGTSVSPVVPYLPAPSSGINGSPLPQAGSGGVGGVLPSGSRSGSAQPWSSLTTGLNPGQSSAAPAAECTGGQLGNGYSSVGTADASGTLYGWFQVTNISATTCQVTLAGTVTVQSVNGTLASRITVEEHTATDPATQLPAPAATPAPIVLPPGQSFVVDFGWVPSGGAAGSACTVSASPTDTTSAAAETGPGADSTSGAVPSASAGSSPGGTPPSVTLLLTPGASGAPTVDAVIGNACAGTVYDTQPLAAG